MIPKMRAVKLDAVKAQCNCLALRRAARQVARRYDEALKPLELSNGQFSILAALGQMEMAGTQRIGEVLGMDRTTVTAALKPLQRRDLVEQVASEADLRTRSVRLTRAGRRLLDQALPLWAQVQSLVEAELGGARSAAQVRTLLLGIA